MSDDATQLCPSIRSCLSAICANYPQRQQMLPHIQRAMELLSAECQNCGTITKPWEGHAPCNPVLPELRARAQSAESDNAQLRERLAALVAHFGQPGMNGHYQQVAAAIEAALTKPATPGEAER